MKRIYLDYAATTPVHPEVRNAMLPYLTEEFGNPSSMHARGLAAKEAVARAREQVAGLIGARPGEVVFTGGGTEADNFAFSGVALARRTTHNHLITTGIEHHAVLETCRFLAKMGFTVSYVPVDGVGLVDPQDIEMSLSGSTVMVSVMHANNEIGAIQPLSEIAAAARSAGVLFHTDAVQTVGRIRVNVDELGVDLLSMSAHKLYGPKGVGALYIRRGTNITPMVHGGAQEEGLRAGTENVPGIVGFGVAADIARRELLPEMKRETFLRDRLIQGILASIDQTSLNGHPEQRLPNNVSINFAGVEGEAILVMLDEAGICASGGSACTSGSVSSSHVLLALGCPPELARGCVRFTLGKWTTEEEIETVLNVLPGIVARLRDMSPTYTS